MNDEIKKKLMVKEKWLRALFMLLFFIIGYILVGLICLIAVFQFIWDLFAVYPNEKVLVFSKQLNSYAYQIVNFLTYNSEEKPFPFNHWPPSS